MPHQWFRGVRIPDPDELEPLKLVGRDEWGAVPPTETKFLKKPIRTLVFAFNTEKDTCTNVEDCKAAVKDLQTYHMDLGYPDIYYNFCIGGDGRIYEGRGWHAWHSARYSVYYGRTLVVGIIGKGKDEEGNWYPPFQKILKKWDKFGRGQGWITDKRKLKYDFEKVLSYEENLKQPMWPYNYSKSETILESLMDPTTKDGLVDTDKMIPSKRELVKRMRLKEKKQRLKRKH
ncbi:peptidoglycan-recognition protein SC1a/b-like isoform X1 [Macrosteles quadrilineatus]|uniref:peptidoglycan-recognition protein SC1a/b-like isoform X1 n=1 Tax=Macrosteles quadrilineatus TaxID=74068 RepID=UPI0023E0C39B|nr:peptidoglycan-recognition protein SC1a/b-like isoform X1 [Macrosteles quadrilineatus]